MPQEKLIEGAARMKSARYTVEHIKLPELFFNSGAMVLHRTLENAGSFLSDLYVQVNSDHDTGRPYSAEDFSESHQVYHEKDDSIMVVRISMPVPDEVLSCRAIYLCLSQRTGSDMLFTSELDANGGFTLCCYNEKGQRINFGRAPLDLQDESDNVALFFREMMKNDGENIFNALIQSTQELKSVCAGKC